MPSLKPLFIVLQLFCALSVIAQTVELYPQDFLPSKPFGGEEEIQRMMKQEMQYPEEAFKNNEGLSVFIKFRVGQKGNVIERYVLNPTNSILESEALFLFDLIAWEVNDKKNDDFIKEEKIRFDFSPKKFKRLVQKRGYKEVPKPLKTNSLSRSYYYINAVNTKPVLANYSSMSHFIQENFKYPIIASQQYIQGKVTAEFIIEKSGKTSNIRITKPLPGGCNEEMKRLIRLMEWKPSTINNEAVRTLYTYELNFKHPGGTVR